MQRGSSNLVDAYKKCELEEGNLGIYALSAIISDKAEPSEALKANVVWSIGLDAPKVLLVPSKLHAFQTGGAVVTETDIKAERGAYFVQSTSSSRPARPKTGSWPPIWASPSAASSS